MNAKRVYFIMVGGLFGVVLLGVVSIVLGNKYLASKATTLSSLRLEGQVLDAKQTILNSEKAEIKKETPLNNIAETVVPQQKDQALAVRDIIGFAAQDFIAISSITFPASNLGLNSNGSSTGSSTPSSTSGVIVPPSQLTPAIGFKGIYVLPITLQSDVNNPIKYGLLTSFLQKLEHNPRTAQINQLTITPASGGSNLLSFNIVIDVYIKR